MHDLPTSGLIVLCGPPCSGKSTFAAAHFDPCEVVSFDDYCQVTGSSDGAVGVMYHIVTERLSLGLRAVINATFLISGSRRHALNTATDLGVPVSVIAFQAPWEALFTRNEARLAPIPFRELEACHVKWQRARREILTEGWDSVRFELTA